MSYKCRYQVMKLFLAFILTMTSFQLWADKKDAPEEESEEKEIIPISLPTEKKLSGNDISGKFDSSIDIATKDIVTPAAEPAKPGATAKPAHDNDRLAEYYKMKADIPKLEAEIEQKKAQIEEADTGWNRFWSPNKTRDIIYRLNEEIRTTRIYINSIRRRIKLTEEELTIQVWRNGLNGLEFVEKKLGSAASILTCPTIQEGTYHFFENNSTHQAWLKAEGEQNKKIAYYANKDPYIQGCLNTKQEGAKTKVSGLLVSLCKLPDKQHTANKKYELKKVNGQIVISTSISFNYKGNAENRAEAFKRVQDAIPCIQEFFAHHGIKLELTIKSESGASSCHHNVNLHDEFARSDSSNWTTHRDLGKVTTAGERCSVFIHELSHILGLPDAYPDPDCPDRQPISAENDIMRTTNIDSSNLTYFPHSIRTLLGPLCDK